MKKNSGSVGNVMMTGMCMLAMTVVMMFYMDSVQLVQQKTEVSQLARKYILRMETVGYMTAQDRTTLTWELYDIGMTEIDYIGTTMSPVSYGNPISLQVRGKLKGGYVIEERRVSTAKH